MKRVIVALIVVAAAATVLIAQTPSATPRVIEISAKKFEFTPNVVKLTKDVPVTIRLTSTDRAHGLFVRALHIDLDADEEPAEITVTPHEAGTYAAICDHYCGSGHGNMKMTFIVE